MWSLSCLKHPLGLPSSNLHTPVMTVSSQTPLLPSPPLTTSVSPNGVARVLPLTVVWKRPTFSKDRTLFLKEKSKLNQGRTLTRKGVHSIRGCPSSVGSPGQGCQHIKSNIKDRSSNVHTSDTVYSIGSHTKWGPKVSGTHSSLERLTPALVHCSTLLTLMTKILTSSSGTPHSTACSSKPWKSWKILAHWPRSPNCTPGPRTSWSTRSWPESCKNSWMRCIN